MSWTGMALDMIIVGLLVATILYCWRLNRLLNVLRDGKGELAQVILQFNNATERAEHSVLDMKQASQAVIDKLQVKIEKAEFLADDLSYIMDKASKSADRLTKNIQLAREVLPEGPVASGTKPALDEPDAAAARGRRPTSRAEQELLEALRKKRGQ